MQSPKAARPSRRETLLPTLAVGAVAAFAVVAAVMVKRTDDPAPQPVASADPARVVTAPKLVAPDTKSMGATASCESCGVVQMVVAVNEAGGNTPRGYQMHIRMDDGSMRTVEQRGALAAGSRVKVEGSTVKPLS